MVKVLQERHVGSNPDIESQLLEAAKNGDIDVVKVQARPSLTLSNFSFPSRFKPAFEPLMHLRLTFIAALLQGLLALQPVSVCAHH